VEAVGQLLGGEGAEHLLGRLAAEVEVVDDLAVPLHQPHLHRRDGGDRAGHAHQGVGRGEGGHLAQEVVDQLRGLADGVGQLLGGRRIADEVLLGEAHAPEVERPHRLHLAGADDELGRPATDVDHKERAVGRVELGGGACEAELALLRAAQQLGPHAHDRLRRIEELVGVVRIPGGGGGRDAQRLHTVLVERHAVVAQGSEGALDRLRVQSTGGVDPLAESGDRVLAIEGQGGPALDAAHEQAGGVGAAVDGGQRRHGRNLSGGIGQVVGHPPAHGVVATDEVPGVVRVEALHPEAGATDASRRAGPDVVARHRRIALGRIAVVGGGQLGRVDLPLGRPHAAVGFEARHEGALRLPHQPVAGGHRRAVVHQRCVAEHHGRPVGVAHHHLEVPLDPSPEEGLHRSHVVRRGHRSPEPNILRRIQRSTSTTA
jgi:hypothetical protein